MLSLDQIILSGGLLAIGFTIFAESGLLIGFFLPGDTLLFGAGLLASQGVIPLPILLLVVIAAAILGDNVGYSIGHRTGRRLFNRKESLLFKHEHLDRAEKFYDRHGGKTIIIARFVPIVRTFAPVVAGIGKMTRRKFVFYNVIGGVLWGGGVTILGYWLGAKVPGLAEYVSHVLLLIIILSFCVATFHLLRTRENRDIIKARLSRLASHMFLIKKK